MIKEIKNFKITEERHEYKYEGLRSNTNIYVTDEKGVIICSFIKYDDIDKYRMYRDIMCSERIFNILCKNLNITGIALNTKTKNIILQINNRTFCFSPLNYNRLLNNIKEDK